MSDDTNAVVEMQPETSILSLNSVEVSGINQQLVYNDGGFTFDREITENTTAGKNESYVILFEMLINMDCILDAAQNITEYHSTSTLHKSSQEIREDNHDDAGKIKLYCSFLTFNKMNYFLDEKETITTLTKKGTERKRKKYKLARSRRLEVKQTKIRNMHSVKKGCQSCKFKCTQFISEDERQIINKEFWSLNWKEKRAYVMSSTENTIPKRKTEGSRKNKTFSYYYKTTDGVRKRVCKLFYLTTLGYKKTNDWIVQSVWSRTESRGQINNSPDKRGRKSPPNKLSNTHIENHIMSFNPSVSHYRRVHAPDRLYLPSDITVTLMFQDFCQKFPNFICSYDKYRKVVKSKNISFAKLGNEECELCESYQIHNPEHKPESLNENCDICCTWRDHIKKAKDSRTRYNLDKEYNYDENTLCVSVDLQKIVMLPRLEMFKRAIFAQRLTTYNESFVPVGKIRTGRFPFAVLWHEGISGRNQEDIISAFNAFFVQNRDIENFILWLDNCSSQNKNWALFSFLIYIVNFQGISAKTIKINYFEPGHTFMSADSFHHQVEESFKRKQKIYDFEDYVSAVQMSNKGKVCVKKMTVTDFHIWKNLSSSNKIKKQTPKVYISKITQILVKRNEFIIHYKLANDDEWKVLDFLLKKHIDPMPIPSFKAQPNGFEKVKVENLLKQLGDLFPENRKQFWLSLPEKCLD